MDSLLADYILSQMQAEGIAGVSSVQSLWSGYGEIVRVKLNGCKISSIIVKRISTERASSHPRGWASSRSHARKLKSYDVERCWYENYNPATDFHCRTPLCFGVMLANGVLAILLEDLDVSGFSLRKDFGSLRDVKMGLSWLAYFHARFFEVKPTGLWEQGSYWHLATRPDELAAMSNEQLQKAAPLLDELLVGAEFQTLIHGDAKIANFCFHEQKAAIAAVDFQYVGKGCGIIDVAYFLGSALTESECAKWESNLLQFYFAMLKNALNLYQGTDDFALIKVEWLNLYNFAVADFQRFVEGWAPDHKKINEYTQNITSTVLKELGL